MKSVVSRFVAIFICLAICLSFGMQCPLKASSASATFVSKAYTDKARYSPGDTVTIYTDLYNQHGAENCICLSCIMNSKYIPPHRT